MKTIHEHGTPEISLRVEALESLLEERGLINPVAVDRVIQHFEQDVGPLNGAKAVARAWIDPDFKSRLLQDAAAAISELGITVGDNVQVIENTPKEHNVVVCSLCSCYPWSVLGLPPTWYKSPAYRARVVREPRKVLAEMGVDLADDVTIRVWDSSAEIRYMILPQRPAGSESLSEEELIPLIMRDAMIGVANVTLPDKG
ncbi:MAG: nitrile hydratase subunit alpha [Alphaproteobacteria bacterium]|nr:MAG: nitrile hydratase subunit alpha [Alphaproteobacteria bacterium]